MKEMVVMREVRMWKIRLDCKGVRYIEIVKEKI